MVGAGLPLQNLQPAPPLPCTVPVLCGVSAPPVLRENREGPVNTLSALPKAATTAMNAHLS